MKKTGLFLLSASESDYFDDNQDKFELVACPIDGKPCMTHIKEINASMKESVIHFRNKDYPRSIEVLKGAYYITDKIHDQSCKNCNELFRLTIYQTLESIRTDLQKMTTGFFSNKRFKSSYKLACNVSDEIRNAV